MSNTTKILTIILLAICTSANSQQSISFAKITLEAASQRANIENKNIFVDAYAPWCGPCKIMDIHFQDKEVRNYFNRNFINVKIDTDTQYGKIVSAKYGIAFLPTVLILDKDGNQRFKYDKLMNRDELLSFAKYAIEGPKYPEPSTPVAVNPAPVSSRTIETKAASTKPKRSLPAQSKTDITATKKTEEPVNEVEQEIIEESSEKILYVLDANATNLPPEILYEEAYFRMQLNDGSHKEASAKYLATQEDWLTERNIKFIFDFLYDTNSEEFKFFVSNKDAFSKYIEAKKIDQSLKILIENKLYQGIPRPDFEQSKYLLSLIDNENSERNNFYYFLNRLNNEGNTIKYFDLAEQYFNKYDGYNQGITIDYITKKLESTTQKSKIKNLVNLLDKIEPKEVDYNYLICNSKIYLALSDKENAIRYADEAINLAKEQKIDSAEAQQIFEAIKEL